MVDICLSVGIFPKVGFKWAELFDDADKCLSVCDDYLNLSPWTYYALMFHCGIDVWIGEPCHLIIIKVDEASSKDFPFLEHQFPTETSGHHLQKQILEQFSIRVARDSPFCIVCCQIKVHNCKCSYLCCSFILLFSEIRASTSKFRLITSAFRHDTPA